MKAPWLGLSEWFVLLGITALLGLMIFGVLSQSGLIMGPEPEKREIGEGRATAEDNSPRYRHDCSICTFLGREGDYDLYYCDAGAKTVIARFGSEGWQYRSGIAFVGRDPELTEAFKRAKEKGLIK